MFYNSYKNYNGYAGHHGRSTPIFKVFLAAVVIITILVVSRSPVFAAPCITNPTYTCGAQEPSCPNYTERRFDTDAFGNCVDTGFRCTNSCGVVCPCNPPTNTPVPPTSTPTPTRIPTPTITTIPTVPINPTATTTPPAPITSRTNPRGCGILYTSGVPSCWCNNGGGQGLCGAIPLATCRTMCESGTFTGPAGFTHCFMMTNGAECASNNDGSYRFCLNECMQGNPGYMHTVGCIYPNTTIFGPATRSGACDAALVNSSNATFLTMIENLIKGAISYITANNYRLNLVRVPGLQKATCNPFKLECERGFTSF